nr:PorP/SprF family type IX secretion system membrane protein [uncultured Flavobacterium sp.]
MKKYALIIVLFLSTLSVLYSQEDGVVSFSLPVRNSLKFNRYIINPTFSFVREQSSYVSFYNKRQWVQFDNAPQTYLFSYSGRFRDNQGIGIGLFQQNYGVLTTFGAVANFAHNVEIQGDKNLTFGINLGFYKSGLNKGKVLTNYPDPALDNIPSNSLIAINPGINYGTEFLDFGLSVNNLVLYNLKTSKIVEDDPQKSIEAHIMHTGYLETYGFLDGSKFSGLLKTELRKDKTIISGLVMFSVPKGIWAQAGYNTLYGMSGGIGLNITPKISVEYNFEKGTGNLSNFGSSHEVVFAYKFKSNNYYRDEDDEGSLISPADESRTVYKKPNVSTPTPTKPIIDAKAKADALAKAKLVADAKTKADAIAQEKLAADAKAKADALAKAKLAADTKTKADALAQAKITADAKAKAVALAKAKLAADTKAKADALAKAKLVADAKTKADAIAQEKLAADAKAKADALAQAKLAADAKAKVDAIAQAKLVADAKAKADALAQEKLAADAKAKADALAQAKLAADAKAKADALAQAKLAADAKAKADALAQEKLAADAKAKADALAQEKLVADAKAKADALAQEKLAADALAQEKLAADAKAKADSIAKAKLAAEALANASKDETAKAMDNLTQNIETYNKNQRELLARLNTSVANKENDLKELREENDLNDKGIFKEPKAFKSTSAENSELESLKLQLAEVNNTQKQSIEKLSNLYNERLKKVSDKNDALTQSYLKTINDLKAEQNKAQQTNSTLLTSLEKIKVETEIEKKRRIKRAVFVNDEQRHSQDVAALKRIKETTPYSATPLKPEDFDYGDEQSNMQILKSIKNVDNGYYIIVAVHSDVAKRDVFLTKTVASGQSNIDFFYDANSSRYFIYDAKFENIEDAKKALKTKGNKPYNGKMTIVKIEN